MKYLITLLLPGLCLLSAACKKESTPNSIIGKWALTESYFSEGGPGRWRPVTDPKQAELVEFKANGAYSSSKTLAFDRYEIADSVTMILSSSANASQPKFTYRYTIQGRSLLLSPLAPYVCIEGCATKYTKQDD
jgi:hypothetical protein